MCSTNELQAAALRSKGKACGAKKVARMSVDEDQAGDWEETFASGKCNVVGVRFCRYLCVTLEGAQAQEDLQRSPNSSMPVQKDRVRGRTASCT